MVDRNMKFNIILGVVCLVLLIVIVYLFYYRSNVESANVYFKMKDIKNITWRSEDAEFYTDGKTFTFKKNNEVIFNSQSYKFDTHTGMVVDGRLYIRNVNNNSILIWYDEAEYRLTKV